ncbi:hypothetical protein MCETHM1_02799 [Flavobacteriaceae bacterium]
MRLCGALRYKKDNLESLHEMIASFHSINYNYGTKFVFLVFKTEKNESY